jgi:hypothetical protein
MKHIVVNCTATDFLSFWNITPFQGDLKDLSAESYQKLKANIIKYGITSPIHVWINEAKTWALDGHQRLRTLTALENEGYTIPLVPVTFIKADSVKDAKKILLSLTSQYGQINPDGLFEFIQDLGFNTLKDIDDEFRLPEIDFDKLGDEYLKDHTDKKEKKPKNCPHCGESI